jgi:hypothetical protein
MDCGLKIDIDVVYVGHEKDTLEPRDTPGLIQNARQRPKKSGKS